MQNTYLQEISCTWIILVRLLSIIAMLVIAPTYCAFSVHINLSPSPDVDNFTTNNTSDGVNFNEYVKQLQSKTLPTNSNSPIIKTPPKYIVKSPLESDNIDDQIIIGESKPVVSDLNLELASASTKIYVQTSTGTNNRSARSVIWRNLYKGAANASAHPSLGDEHHSGNHIIERKASPRAPNSFKIAPRRRSNAFKIAHHHVATREDGTPSRYEIVHHASSIKVHQAKDGGDNILSGKSSLFEYDCGSTPHFDSTAPKLKACELPNCKCQNLEVPGRLPVSQTPQFVMLTFDDAINAENFDLYLNLSRARINPNGCPAQFTFFVSHEWTNYQMVAYLYDMGHEIASHSITHRTPQTWWKEEADYDDWRGEIAGQRKVIAEMTSIPQSEIRGMRAPFLQPGGNNQFAMLTDEGFEWDSSFPTPRNDPPIWPYTLHTPPSDCQIPPCLSKGFQKLWEVPMVDFVDANDNLCSMVDQCHLRTDTAEDVFEFLGENFLRHYGTNKAPFPLFMHSAWLTTNPKRRLGFIKFLDTIAKLEDVYLVSLSQMLDWVRKPIELSRMKPVNRQSHQAKKPPKYDLLAKIAKTKKRRLLSQSKGFKESVGRGPSPKWRQMKKGRGRESDGKMKEESSHYKNTTEESAGLKGTRLLLGHNGPRGTDTEDGPETPDDLYDLKAQRTKEAHKDKGEQVTYLMPKRIQEKFIGRTDINEHDPLAPDVVPQSRLDLHPSPTQAKLVPDEEEEVTESPKDADGFPYPTRQESPEPTFPAESEIGPDPEGDEAPPEFNHHQPDEHEDPPSPSDTSSDSDEHHEGDGEGVEGTRGHDDNDYNDEGTMSDAKSSSRTPLYDKQGDLKPIYKTLVDKYKKQMRDRQKSNKGRDPSHRTLGDRESSHSITPFPSYKGKRNGEDESNEGRGSPINRLIPKNYHRHYHSHRKDPTSRTVNDSERSKYRTAKASPAYERRHNHASEREVGNRRQSRQCSPEICRLPMCRCASPDIPFEMRRSETPQLVLLSFSGAINELNYPTYIALLGNISNSAGIERRKRQTRAAAKDAHLDSSKLRLNPNGCPISATFFTSHEWTNYQMVHDLYKRGNEIGLNSISYPDAEWWRDATYKDWSAEIGDQKKLISNFANISESDVVGVRVPYMRAGGNTQFQMLKDNGLLYDASISTDAINPPLWPFTLDYKSPLGINAQCTGDFEGNVCPTDSFPGLWEVPLVNYIDGRGKLCATLTNCQLKDDDEATIQAKLAAKYRTGRDRVATPTNEDDEHRSRTKQVFELLSSNFFAHYESNRAPFPVPLFWEWLSPAAKSSPAIGNTESPAGEDSEEGAEDTTGEDDTSSDEEEGEDDDEKRRRKRQARLGQVKYFNADAVEEKVRDDEPSSPVRDKNRVNPNLQGLINFLDMIGTMDDVYVVSHKDAISWIENPIESETLSNPTSFFKKYSQSLAERPSYGTTQRIYDDPPPGPWMCKRALNYGRNDEVDNKANCMVMEYTNCAYDTEKGLKYFFPCGECPKKYPWVNNPLGE